MLEMYPGIAQRPCKTCRQFLYDDGPEGTGKIVERIPDQPEPRGDFPTPCETDQGCPKGHWSNPRELNPQNQLAYQFHRMHVAAGRPLPDDPIVLRNAYLIDLAERKCAEFRRKELLSAIAVGAMRRLT